MTERDQMLDGEPDARLVVDRDGREAVACRYPVHQHYRHAGTLGVVGLALELENIAAETYVKDTTLVSSTSNKALFASIMGIEAQHVAVLLAVQALLKKTGLNLKDIDVFEVNEAFAAQALAVLRALELPPDRTNPNGSGISLGHPIGATGCILVVKALYELKRTGGRRALVTMCIGGGQGIAAIFERM